MFGQHVYPIQLLYKFLYNHYKWSRGDFMEVQPCIKWVYTNKLLLFCSVGEAGSLSWEGDVQICSVRKEITGL